MNREVQARQTTGKGHGLSVDVVVSGGTAEAPIRQPRCVIEVKGSWNDGLLADQKTQLIDDYLPALHTTRGTYVCGWFPADMWNDRTDSRRAKAARRDRATVAAELAAAAAQASTGGVQVQAIVIDIPRPHPSDRAQGSG